MKKAFLRGIFSIVTGVLLLSTPQVRGVVYWDSDYGFYPSAVLISPGDTVYWVNGDLYGFPVQVTSDVPFGNPNYFSFLLVDFGDGYGVTFNNQGTFGYHSSYSQQGYVVVNIPPSVTITNPANNAVFSAPATFTIQADASETPDDIVWDVEFFLGTSGGTNSIVDDILAPFSASVTNLAAGTYTLIAIATDYYFATATNAITITVGSATPITLNAPRVSGNQFLFDVAGLTIGKTNVVQASTNLTNWTSIKTNVAAVASITVTNAVSSGAHLYRVLQWP
jgi:plastocyanin